MSEKTTGTATAQQVDLNGLNPIPHSLRTMSPMSYSTVLWSSYICVQILTIGLYLMPPTGVLNLTQVMVGAVISGIIAAAMTAINGDAGARYGIPFVMQARISFGTKGAKVVGFLRSIPAICWNGICTWYGADALNVVCQTIFGFGNTFVFFFILLIIEAILSIRGFQTIKWFDSVMSVVIFAILFYFFYYIFANNTVDFKAALAFKGSWGLPFIAGIMGGLGNLTTCLLSASDLTRHIKFKNNGEIVKKNTIFNFIGTMPPYLFMFAAGIVVSLATGARNPIVGLASIAPNPLFAIILLVFLMLAQVTSNLSLNILCAGIVFQDVFHLNWKKSIILVAILSVAICPWILQSSDYFFMVQNGYSCLLGPTVGVLVADYYFFRKKNLNVEDLYEGTNYVYFKGYSIIAVVALAVGAVAAACFFDYSWLVGFPVSLVCYTVLKKFWKVEQSAEQAQGVYIAR